MRRIIARKNTFCMPQQIIYCFVAYFAEGETEAVKLCVCLINVFCLMFVVLLMISGIFWYGGTSLHLMVYTTYKDMIAVCSVMP